MWGENLSKSAKSAKWIEYDGLIVVTPFLVMKLSWVGKRTKYAHDRIVSAVRDGKVKCMVDLYSLIGKEANRYGAPTMLVETKLERYL